MAGADRHGIVGIRRRLRRNFVLVAANRAYEKKFGYIFIVCAAGKSTEEILALLTQRIANDPAVELRIAADEQRKITRLRLERLLTK